MSLKFSKSTNFIIALALLLFLIVASCAKEPDKGTVTVGSKIDTEGALLGNIIATVLSDAGFTIEDRIQTGTTPVVREAITSGEIDIYPEYTGNGFYLFSGETEAELWKNPDSAYETVKKLDYDANKIVWLTPAPANNTWAIAVREDLAKAESLKTLEDLGAYISSGRDFKIAASEEFVSSEAALPSFEEGYGFSLTEDQLLVFSSGNTAVTEQAAASGSEGVNAAMAYGTDGQLSALGLVVMEDTKGIQPVYEPAPIIREEVFTEYPEIETLLKPVFESLDLVTLQTLNARISVEGENAAMVAEDYLKTGGFIKE